MISFADTTRDCEGSQPLDRSLVGSFTSARRSNRSVKEHVSEKGTPDRSKELLVKCATYTRCIPRLLNMHTDFPLNCTSFCVECKDYI
jgi:hypothetical protein